MSMGINLLLSLVKSATKALHDDFDIEIIESHHKDKVDAPSGTAIELGEMVANNSGRTLKEHGTFKREGNMDPRDRKEIGFSTISAHPLQASCWCRDGRCHSTGNLQGDPAR